jgi:hypothetical protein
MTPKNADASALPSTADNLPSYEPDPIIIPYRDILDPVVGRLTHVEVGRADAEKVAWAGIDATGSLRTGTMRLRIDAGVANSIMLGWDVEVDDWRAE